MEREVYWIGEVNDENMQRVMGEIRKLQSESNEKIRLYIHSRGGRGSIGRGFYDWVRLKKIPLETIGIGEVNSAAILILLAGIKRKATINTHFEIHEVGKGYRVEAEFTLPQLKEIVSRHELACDSYCQILGKETKIPIKELLEIVKEDRKDLILTVKEAKEKGLIEEIIET